MSIIIKSLDSLPEHCFDCPCHDGESGYCQADKEHRYSDYRPFWCPLSNSQETVTEFADRCRECGKMKRCRDCKYFEYDSVANWDGIPIIVAHEICSKWGDGCKTSENGYCFLFEPKEDEK